MHVQVSEYESARHSSSSTYYCHLKDTQFGCLFTEVCFLFVVVVVFCFCFFVLLFIVDMQNFLPICVPASSC